MMIRGKTFKCLKNIAAEHPQEKRAGVAELVDAPDLGSGAYGVGVRVPSPAPLSTRLEQSSGR